MFPRRAHKTPLFQDGQQSYLPRTGNLHSVRLHSAKSLIATPIALLELGLTAHPPELIQPGLIALAEHLSLHSPLRLQLHPARPERSPSTASDLVQHRHAPSPLQRRASGARGANASG